MVFDKSAARGGRLIHATGVPEVRERPGHPLEPYFDEWRRRRRERYASRDAIAQPKRRAVLTIVRDETVFLPIWLGYYSRYFAPEDIYLLDHASSDGSTAGNGFVRVPVEHRAVYDSSWLTDTVQAHQHELFDRYELVLTVDVDEIVVPDPRWGTLGKYLDRFDEEFVNCLGYEVLHLKDVEPPFQADRPVLHQRGYWYANGAYDKPALASSPTEWARCFHSRADGRTNYDPDLRMIHLHRMDYDLCLARHRRHGDQPWNRRDIAERWGYHNRITEEDRFERWFYEDSCFEEVPIVLERIPEVWNNVV